ncbi:MAG: Asp-tRNA(Asn)/Glu-tRNA(Gln) amidotransferase subunit GatB [Patescibacteria group bacterium]|nr:Asp-tRNA(Asn)/Glu-tRNA(Gln) amidotransferase subunit GatB [Patescibacteria group bacterium]MDD5121608.1 Asp-tRNA(Asn)/Glu-tRNA(Gln) amidotransferase subunit GatB [Patescibacteria group bacterium]MDD5222206.1 Asp-tRNA(Asn)/Glu-tRNA(Gln) amidotransferase subunit GatB [Patescibacteria group bacterium]MDD5396228.1 Asp-tRNA(Asn)/Glu-tRNA(Gln) amidotransferase subunit GatB [Patescibacteria group bacterium]
MELEPIIGLEIHLQLKTKSKMFCDCQNEWLDASPNVNICPICFGHPGVLPVINRGAVEMALNLGLALEGDVAQYSKFDRKNYFYPDLPKGYQISQYAIPIVKKAKLKLNEDRTIRINRIHLEEDTAKLIHTPDYKWSLLDYNRAGIPLLEVVTEPDFKSPEEAKLFLRELQLLARYLNISWADMEKGQMRCDTNISLRPKGDKKLYPKAEIKNLNSFRAVEESLRYEIKRQSKLWEAGNPPSGDVTFGWDEKKKITIEQRTKEGEMDYRYFPEPDLPPLLLTAFNLNAIKKDLTELPMAKRGRFMKSFGFSEIEARILTDDIILAHFTEKTLSELKAWLISIEEVEGSEQKIWEKHKEKFVKLVGSWLINRLMHLMDKYKTASFELKITPENFAEFIILLYKGNVSSTLGQQILEKMFLEGLDADEAIKRGSMNQIDDQKQLEKIIDKIIKNNPKVVADYKKGKTNAIAFLVGLIMRETKGRAKVELVKEILEEKL